MNRFDNGSVSAYTPQSFQELAFVPLLKRQKHDEMDKSLAELNVIATDPLNEHRDEALRLKQDVEGKLSNLSGELASRGIDNIGKDAFYKIQKERNDLIAPTGRIGQINAAKVAEAEAYKRFLTSDDAKSNSQEVNLANWQKFRNQYKGYDDKNNIINIGDLGAVRYIDEQKMLSDARSDLGMNEQSFKQASSMLNDTGNANGTRFTVNTSKAGSTGSNYEQVKAMADYFNKRISDPSDPFRKSLDYTGRDLNKTWDQMSSHMNIMKKYQHSSESERSLGNVDYYDPPKGNGESLDPTNPMGITQETTTIGQKPEEYNDLNKIGLDQTTQHGGGTQIIAGLGPITGNNATYEKTGKKWTTKDIQNPIVKQQYDVIFNDLKKHGKLPQNADKDSNTVAKLIQKEILSQGPITISSNVLVPDRTPNEIGFAGELATKDITARTNSIAKDLVSGRRSMQDPENPNKVLTTKEFNDRGYKVSYDAQYSPMNFTKNPFNYEDQGAIPHQVLVTDKEGNRLGKALVDRTPQEIKSPAGQAAIQLHEVFNKTLIVPNREVPISNNRLKAKGVNQLNVTYITKDPMTGQPLQEPYYNVSVNGKTATPMSEQTLTSSIYNTIGR